MLKLDFYFEDNIMAYVVSKMMHRRAHHQINESKDVQ